MISYQSVMLFIAAAGLIVPPQEIGEGFSYEQIQAMMNTVWRIDGTEPFFVMRSAEIPRVSSEIPYHAAALLMIDDTFRIIDYEIRTYQMWWKVRVISGEYTHASGYVANAWLQEWCERADE